MLIEITKSESAKKHLIFPIDFNLTISISQ